MNSNQTTSQCHPCALELLTTPSQTDRDSILPASRMKSAIHRSILGFLALILAAVSAPRVTAQSYVPTDITVPDGAFRADAMNDHGQVAGSYTRWGQLEQPAV